MEDKIIKVLSHEDLECMSYHCFCHGLQNRLVCFGNDSMNASIYFDYLIVSEFFRDGGSFYFSLIPQSYDSLNKSREKLHFSYKARSNPTKKQKQIIKLYNQIGKELLKTERQQNLLLKK